MPPVTVPALVTSTSTCVNAIVPVVSVIFPPLLAVSVESYSASEEKFGRLSNLTTLSVPSAVIRVHPPV